EVDEDHRDGQEGQTGSCNRVCARRDRLRFGKRTRPKMRHTARTHRLGATLLGAWLTIATTSCSRASGAAAHQSEQQRIARASYLVTTLGCNDCHTPLHATAKGPEPDMARMLSGHPESLVVTRAPKLEEPWAWAGTGTNTAFAGPWGISYAPNLTPDQNTGL